MAYASVASLLETIHLVNYHGDSSISTRFKDQITSLHQHACFLQSFLEDGDPNRVRNWEETIRDVTDRAEEIIDILVSDSLLKSSKSEEVDGGMDDELEKVTKEMESTIERVKGRSTNLQAGLDEDLLDIVDRLTSGSRDLQTIAIVGMGGMGMSTLARKAYDHPLVVEHFDFRAWSTVAQEYNGRDIIEDLLLCINQESDSVSENEETILFKYLYDRKYLILLNDLWSADVWHKVRRAFPDNRNGSRIILTTRFLELASLAGHVHEMRLLDEDGTWKMLREKIFKGDPCPSQLESTGKTIARSCGGHRLSIEVVCGILAADQTKAAWEDFSENIKIASEEDDFGFPQVLSLSYTYLPHHLRPCFLYWGCFPEYHEMRISKLISLWVAEGFLNESENKSFEEIGEEHVEELVRRSLFSVSKRRYNGRIKTITVHALMRDQCLREARMGNFFHDVGRFEMHESCRRVFSSNNCRDFVKDVYDSTIRTAILYSTEEGVRWSIENARLLRILDLSGAPHYELPEEVFELFHLRYLAFHSGFSISEAISNLQNLQTLVIFPWEYAEEFDYMLEGIWRMPQLRLVLSFNFKLPTLKLGEGEGEGEISALENLETLSGVVDFVCSKENLKMIPNVKKLHLIYTKDSIDAVEHHVFHNFVSLHRLENLEIEHFCPSFLENYETSFAFPPTLKKLILWGVKLPWEDMKIVASLPNLEVLKLRCHACVGKTWKTSEGGFSRLTHLLIEESFLEHWITESSHFPRLKRLVLRECDDLSEVPREIGEIPTLQLMELDYRNQSLLDSAMQLQEDRKSLGDDLLQVLVIGQR